ncbi:hypothetical protein ACFYV5_10205 [Streptomyces sp. NPDC003035]|uniref:hypothetical protein n=1 Tax=Streptomyces sp. NPDC003035 TaxID=3364676 RepID=UPI003688D6FF
MPLLFIEVDNCHEAAEELADKLEKYARFFRRKVKDTDGRERPMWRTRWSAPATWSGDAAHPPVLLVFNRVGERNPNRTVPRLQELTRHLWQGERYEDHHVYDGRMPIIATGLNHLGEHGPEGPVFLRLGRDYMQPLREAIGNPRREAADAREQEQAKARQQEYQAQVRRAAQEQEAKKAAEREARRPVCTECGAAFTDERWKATERVGWLPQSPTRLCARTATGASSPTFSKPGRTSTGMNSRARPCPGRRRAEPGSPASAGETTAPRLSAAAARLKRMDRDDEQLLRRRSTAPTTTPWVPNTSQTDVSAEG